MIFNIRINPPGICKLYTWIYIFHQKNRFEKFFICLKTVCSLKKQKKSDSCCSRGDSNARNEVSIDLDSSDPIFLSFSICVAKLT